MSSSTSLLQAEERKSGNNNNSISSFSLTFSLFFLRLLLEDAKVNYKYTIAAFPLTPEVKASLPFGQVPVLLEMVNGKTKTYSQSHAIVRHLARKYGMLLLVMERSFY